MNARETAWRIFAGELNASSLERKATEEKMPSYVVTPLGTLVNRVLVTGVLLEKENAGTEDEPMWRGRVQDVSGNFFISVGRFQPEAAAAMVDMECPSFVAIVGKVRTFTTADGRVFVSVRPERIVNIDEATRNLWLLEASQSMWRRLLALKGALTDPDVSADDLVARGMPRRDAEGVADALDHYGFPQSERYLKLVQGALRMLLPDRDIDLGLPGDDGAYPEEEGPAPKAEGGMSVGDREDVILRILDELETNGKGAPRDELERRAEAEGISATDVEEISNSLMDKGLAYEPNLGYLRRIK